MNTTELNSHLADLQALDLTGKGEAFVESRFVTPLLKCLGYETHRDYEVIRHGDDGSAFRLRHVPVEQGARSVRSYNPDYVPTIRKKMFWIIEAKSPKDVSHPFDTKYLIQGLQYCIHPEVQAKYLLLTNGQYSSVYDAYSSIFLGADIYRPIMEFECKTIISNWPAIYDLFSVERIRGRIEVDLQTMFDKLCLSSLDETYPRRLIGRIGASIQLNCTKIRANVNELRVESFNVAQNERLERLNRQSAQELFRNMEFPGTAFKAEGPLYVEAALLQGETAQSIYNKLVADFDQQRMFRKCQTISALCTLSRRTDKKEVLDLCRTFFDYHKDRELPLVSQLECALLRVNRKMITLTQYPALRQKIEASLAFAPELVRFVNPPTVVDLTYAEELAQAIEMFARIKMLPDEPNRVSLANILRLEAEIEQQYRDASASLAPEDVIMDGRESIGLYPMFKRILINRGFEPAE